MKKKIAIIEDEVIIAENLGRIVKKLGYEVVAVANSYAEGGAAITAGLADMYLIDINLKEGENNGIKLAREVSNNSQKPIIFISSYADTETINKAKFTNPVGYILKPFNQQTIYSTLEIAFHNYQKQQNGLTVRHKGDIVRVPFRDIMFLKANSVYVEIHTAQSSYLHRASLKALSKLLPDNFVRVHRSYIVNLEHAMALNSNVILIVKHRIPIGRRYKNTVLKSYAGT